MRVLIKMLEVLFDSAVLDNPLFPNMSSENCEKTCDWLKFRIKEVKVALLNALAR